MPHKLLLGFKQNPSGTDDYIDLGGSLNVNAKGYHLKSYLEGPVTTDEYGHMVRDLTIVLNIDDATIAGAMAKYHAIDRYIQQTRIYLQPFKGNWAATTDGTWYSGFCATLTFQPIGASKPVYWDVIGGSLTRDETYLGENLVGGVLENVTVTLTVRYSARGDLVTMNNLVAMGSFEPPFNPKDSFFDAGWTFASTTPWSVDFGTGKYGPNSLKWTGVSSTTVTTNDNPDIFNFSYNSSHVMVSSLLTVSAAFWMKSSGVTGTTTVTIEGLNGSLVWVTLGTVASVAGSVANWTYYKLENITPTSCSKVRLKITTPTSGTVYFDGVAIWKSATVPANGEYFSHGCQNVLPSAYLYGAVGDLEAPCLMHVGFPLSGFIAANNTWNYNAVVVGAREYNWTGSYRDSIPALAGDFADAGSDAGLFWGQTGHTVTGTGITSATFNLVTGTNLSVPTLKVPRKYQVWMGYNSTIAMTSMNLWMEGDDPNGFAPKNYQTFTKTIPSTSVDQLFYLGDMIYPSPDTSFENQTFIGIDSVDTASRMKVQFSFPSASPNIRLSGILLIPYEMSCFYANTQGATTQGGYTTIFSSMADPENGSVKALRGNVAVYDPSLAGEIFATSSDNSDVLQVIPGAMQFEVLALKSQDSSNKDLFIYHGSALPAPVSVTLVYQPRYLSGGM
jgi:hypothetical protein